MNPLHVTPGKCAVVERAPGGQWGANCHRPVAARARWRFHDETKSLLLCAEHVDEFEGDERLSHVVRFYDATVEG